MADREPSRNRVQQPQLSQDVSVGDSCCLGGLVGIPWSCRVEDRDVRRAGARGGGVGREPGTQGGGSTHGSALLGELPFDDHVEIPVQLRSASPRREGADSRESGPNYLLRIVEQPHRRFTTNGQPSTG